MNVSSLRSPLVVDAVKLVRERDALLTRVRILEAVLAGIEREADCALVEPGIAFLVTRRIAAVARQAKITRPEAPHAPTTPKPPDAIAQRGEGARKPLARTTAAPTETAPGVTVGEAG